MLSISGLTKKYKKQIIFDQLDFTIESGRFAVFIGPSGCGKSTLFDVLSGITQSQDGTITWNGDQICHLGHITAYMHQKDLLLPWCTLLDNVLLPVRVGGHDLSNARQRAEQLFLKLGLAGYENYFPSQISGGMRQRCALVRTLMFERDLILLDEPLSALDAITQRSLQSLLLRVQAEFQKTVIMITHDIEEALLLADELFLLSARPMKIRKKYVMTTAKPRKFNDPELLVIKEHVLAMLEGDICHEDI